MKTLVLSAAVVLVLAATAAPQSLTPHREPISKTNFTTMTIDVSGASSTGTARAFLPALESPLPVIVFSHSRIDFGDTNVDLTPMAEQLARDGNAVLVLDRTLMWPPKTEKTNRDGYELLENTEKWILEHVKFTKFAYVGPNFDTGEQPYPLQALPRDRKRITRTLRVPLGESGNAKSTEMLRTITGQRQMMRDIELALKLNASS